MSDDGKNFEVGNKYGNKAENDTNSYEATQRLQYMVAYLLKKNEELRMQLMAEDSEEEA